MKSIYIVLVLTVICIFLLFITRPSNHVIPKDYNIWNLGNDIMENVQLGLYPKNIGNVDIPVLYINLDKSTDRRKYIETQLKKYNINGERISAVNGTELSSLFSSSSSDKVQFTNNYVNLEPNELGCTLSHLLAIKTAYDRNYDKVLIIEDDCCFDLLPFWNNSLSDIILDCDRDWEIIQLFSMTPTNSDKTWVKNHNKYYYGMLAYVVNKNGMEKILNSVGKDYFQLGKRNHPKMGYSDRFIYDLAITYTKTTPLLFPNNLEHESTIHESHTNGHIQRSKDIVDMYIKSNFAVSPHVDKQQVQMTKALTDIKNCLDIPFFLVDGTLLGCYREKTFIKGDKDIDLGVFAKDMKQLPDNLYKDGNHLFSRIHEYGTMNKGYECTYKHLSTGIPVDVFVFYPEDEHVWSASYNGLCNKATYKMCRWKNKKFGLKSINFVGQSFNIPDDPERFLVERYGVNWNIPNSFSYFEGLNNSLYKGLILTDFNDSDRPIQKYEQKIECSYWPRKILELNKPIIWMYWENLPGNTKPPYLELCLETIYKTCGDDFEIIMLNDSLVKCLSRTIHPNFTNIHPLGMRADYVRFTMISEYGGIWLDSDTIVLKSLIVIPQILQKYNFVGFEHDAIGDLSIGIFGGNRFNRICMFMKYLFETEFGKWKDREYKIGWALPHQRLGEYVKLLNYIYSNDYTTLYAPETVYPVHWKKSKYYYWSNGDVEKRLDNFMALCMHNETYTKRQKQMSKEDILNSDMVLGKIFRNVLER